MTPLFFEGTAEVEISHGQCTAIPERYLGDLLAADDVRLVVTKHPQGCLMVFPRAAWLSFRTGVALLPISASAVKRLFIGSAAESSLDECGSFALDRTLAAFAAIKDRALLLGMGSHFELWDPEAYAARELAALEESLTGLDGLQF